MFVMMISRSNSNMGGVGSKSRSLGQILLNLVSTLAATVLTQSYSNLLRMFVLMISGSRLVMVGMGSKCRSLRLNLTKNMLAL